MSRFKKAVRSKSKLRLAIDGPSGAGKTVTALRFACTLGKRIAVIDSENGSAAKYQGTDFEGGRPIEFDVLELSKYSPTDYTAAIEEAGREGYDVLVIDSLSHAWAGEGGALELKDRQADSERSSFTAWKTITPMHNRMVEAILKSPCHVIATMRSKTEYVLEVNERGKQVPRKVGTAPIQRPGMEYEFDIYGSMDHAHILTVTKSRCPAVADQVVAKPGAEFMRAVAAWLESGVDEPQPQPQPKPAPQQPQPAKQPGPDAPISDEDVLNAVHAVKKTWREIIEVARKGGIDLADDAQVKDLDQPARARIVRWLNGILADRAAKKKAKVPT